jgi:uncharacterized protein
MDRQLIEQLMAYFATLAGVDLVYLFGSRVGENIGPMSDYDLAIQVANGTDTEYLSSRIIHEAKINLGIAPVDLVFLNNAPIELAYAIIAQGICLYQKDPQTRIEFEANVLSRYCDYLPVLRAQRKDILKGGDDVRRVQRYREALRRTERTLSQNN